MMDGIDMGAAGKRLGPLPVWGWGVILGVLAVVWVWWSATNKAASQTDATPYVSGATDSSALDAMYAGGGYGGNVAGSSQAAPTGDVQTFGTNLEWLNKAVSLVGDKYGTSRLDVQSALQAYLMGSSLTANQKVIVQRALSLNNLPPEGVEGLVNNGVDTYTPTTPVTTTPVTPATETPATETPATPEPVYYWIRWGDTLTSIARKYGTTVNALVSLNGIRNPDLIYAGTRIRIK